jgi:transmembrane sensor
MSIEEKAAEWFVELQSAQRIEDKWQEFERWKEESRKHEVAFTRIENAWSLADRLRDTAKPDLLSLGIEVDGHGMTRALILGRWIRELKWRLLWTVFFAGCVLYAIRYELQTRSVASGRSPWKTVATGIGEHQTVSLSDGSTVDLNTNTILRVSIDSDERQVDLDRGEALFNVVHDPMRPFSVRAGRGRVEAVGTKFSVMDRSDGEMITMVTEGNVRVYAPSDASQWVGPQQSATTTERGIEVEKMKPGESQRRMAWTRGELQFSGETLDEAVTQFNRYNEKQLQIVDPAIRNRPIGGTFSARDPEGFADMIEKSLDVRHFTKVTEDGTPIIALTGKGSP